MLISIPLKLEPARLVHHHHSTGGEAHFTAAITPRRPRVAAQRRQYSSARGTERDQLASD